MDDREVAVKIDGLLLKAKLSYDVESSCIDLAVNGAVYFCCAENLFSSFIKLRAMLPNVEFFL